MKKTKVLKAIALLGLSLVLTMGMVSCKFAAYRRGIIIEQKSFEVGGVSFKMNKIAEVKGGPSTIGDDTTSGNEKRPVQISAYMIGETEVTQELWQAVMGNNPSNFKNSPASGETQSKRPVERVSWYDAIAFCNKLSIKLGKEPCYKVQVGGVDVDFATLTYADIPTSSNSDWNNATLDLTKNGFRLPTESEWEWAAKGGSEDKYAGANTAGDLVNYAWYNSNAGGKTHEVKKKKANGYGLYDMSGNVWEWTYDWQKSITGGVDLGKDYTGASSGSHRVYRGGSWIGIAGSCARASHFGNTPDFRHHSLGFRLACRP